jgi:CheY-like chemotaxis protein
MSLILFRKTKTTFTDSLNPVVTDNKFSTTESGLTVFLAEDDPDDQELLQEAFLKIDPAIRLHSFSTGKKFIDTLDSFDANPALIILDYNIPEMNGAEVLKHISKNEQYDSIIKIVWSTSNSPFYENSCLALGASAYFVKPSTLSGLSQLARTMLSYVDK